MTDPIADMLARIKNALLARHSHVIVPYSKMKKSLADILLQEGYVSEVQVKDMVPQPEIVLQLKYIGKLPAVNDIRRLSKPGRRLYAPAKDIPKALGGYGVTIISTSRGIMTDTQARKENVGGELLCQIW